MFVRPRGRPNLQTLSRADVEAYVRTIAAAISRTRDPTAKQMQVLYNAFAAHMIQPDMRQQILVDVITSRFNDGALDLPVAEHAATALTADLLRVQNWTSEPGAATFIQQLFDRLGITSEQLYLLRGWIEWENKVLAGIGRSDAMTSLRDYSMELAKRLVAAGLPLSALYFSGSVAGFSAAGITSGLAALGGNSAFLALGLNPMTAGIAAMIFVGIAVKKILDYVPSGSNRAEMEQAAAVLTFRRELAKSFLYADLAIVGRRRGWWLPYFGPSRRRRVVNALRNAYEEMHKEPDVPEG